MILSHFENHLKDPAPGFLCCACGDPDENLTFVARVNNHINKGAGSQLLVLIEELLGSAEGNMKKFYANHNGLLMYEDQLSIDFSGEEFRAAGMAFFPVNEWKQKSSDMVESLVAMGWPREDMPRWLLQGIAFGEIPHSANYFVIQPTGEDRGKIFYADHDAYEPDPVFDSFEKLLEGIFADPADFLNRFGCYTRYTDGKTETQWIPKEYVTGVSEPS